MTQNQTTSRREKPGSKRRSKTGAVATVELKPQKGRAKDFARLQELVAQLSEIMEE